LALRNENLAVIRTLGAPECAEKCSLLRHTNGANHCLTCYLRTSPSRRLRFWPVRVAPGTGGVYLNGSTRFGEFFECVAVVRSVQLKVFA
jgi:hypothetical protein